MKCPACKHIVAEVLRVIPRIGQEHLDDVLAEVRRRLICVESKPRKVTKKCKVCQCSLRTSLVGDGCDVCNPTLAKELTKAKRKARGRGKAGR